jgi:hypothetical protein
MTHLLRLVASAELNDAEWVSVACAQAQAEQVSMRIERN